MYARETDMTSLSVMTEMRWIDQKVTITNESLLETPGKKNKR